MKSVTRQLNLVTGDFYLKDVVNSNPEYLHFQRSYKNTGALEFGINFIYYPYLGEADRTKQFFKGCLEYHPGFTELGLPPFSVVTRITLDEIITYTVNTTNGTTKFVFGHETLPFMGVGVMPYKNEWKSTYGLWEGYFTYSDTSDPRFWRKGPGLSVKTNEEHFPATGIAICFYFSVETEDTGVGRGGSPVKMVRGGIAKLVLTIEYYDERLTKTTKTESYVKQDDNLDIHSHCWSWKRGIYDYPPYWECEIPPELIRPGWTTRNECFNRRLTTEGVQFIVPVYYDTTPPYRKTEAISVTNFAYEPGPLKKDSNWFEFFRDIAEAGIPFRLRCKFKYTIPKVYPTFFTYVRIKVKIGFYEYLGSPYRPLEMYELHEQYFGISEATYIPKTSMSGWTLIDPRTWNFVYERGPNGKGKQVKTQIFVEFECFVETDDYPSDIEVQYLTLSDFCIQWVVLDDFAKSIYCNTSSFLHVNRFTADIQTDADLIGEVKVSTNTDALPIKFNTLVLSTDIFKVKTYRLSLGSGSYINSPVETLSTIQKAVGFVKAKSIIDQYLYDNLPIHVVPIHKLSTHTKNVQLDQIEEFLRLNIYRHPCYLTCTTLCQVSSTAKSKIKDTIRSPFDRVDTTASCNQGCQRSCELFCEKGCENKCQGLGACESNCEFRCEIHCQASCEFVCQKGCEGSCEDSCQNYCQDSCESQCEDSCEEGCEDDCEYGCTGGCEGTCEDFCTVECQNTCEYDCQTPVQEACPNKCEVCCEESCECGCEEGCEAGCEEGCEAAGCELDCESGKCQTGCMLGDCQVGCAIYCMSSCETGSCERGCTGGVCQTGPCEAQPCQTICAYKGCENLGCQTCESYCQLNCTFGCQGTCAIGCMVLCQKGCTAGACQMPCIDRCTYGCQGGCQSMCTAICQEGCVLGRCQTTCANSCQTPCQAGSCQECCQCKCEESCTSGCTKSCTSDKCQTECQAVCEAQGGCEIACESGCVSSKVSGCEFCCELCCEDKKETPDQTCSGKSIWKAVAGDRWEFVSSDCKGKCPDGRPCIALKPNGPPSSYGISEGGTIDYGCGCGEPNMLCSGKSLWKAVAGNKWEFVSSDCKGKCPDGRPCIALKPNGPPSVYGVSEGEIFDYGCGCGASGGRHCDLEIQML